MNLSAQTKKDSNSNDARMISLFSSLSLYSNSYPNNLPHDTTPL